MKYAFALIVLLFASSAFADVKYFLNIEMGKKCNVTKERRVIIKSQQAFEKIWKEAFPNRPVPTYSQAPGNGLPPVKLDFTKGVVFVAFMGEENRQDSYIKVTEVMPMNGILYIKVKKFYPKVGLAQPVAATSAPYHFIWISRVNDTVVVEDIE